MAFVTQFCPLNAVRFYPENNDLPDNINTVPFGWKAWSDSFPIWQTRKNYYTPAYFDDTCTIMVFTQNNDLLGPVLSPPVLEVWQRNNDTVVATDPGYKGTVVNTYMVDTDPITGTQTPMYATCWSFKWTTIAADLDANTGDYYFKLYNYGADGVVNVPFLSDYIRLYDNQPDTVLITSKYNTNKQNVVVDGWNGGFVPTFYTRIEASIRRMEIEGYQQAYLQQNYNQLATYTANWKRFTFRAGHKNGIPEYMLQTLTFALTADLVTIDGVYYKRKGEHSSNATDMWQITRTDPDPLIQAECKLYEYDNSMGSVYRNSPITLMLAPDDGAGAIRYPFAFNYISMRTPASVTATTDAYAIYNSTDLNDLLAYLNGAFKSANGMLGYFAVSGLAVVYFNGFGESWSANTGTITFGRYMAFTTNNNDLTFHNGFSYQVAKVSGGTSWKAIIDYGDGTLDVRGSTTTEHRQHRYSSTGVKTAYFFHTGEDYTPTDSIGTLRFKYYGDDGYYNNIVAGSNCPTELTSLKLDLSDTSNITSIDMSCIQACAATLRTLWIEGGKIDSFSNNVFDGGASFVGPITDYIIRQSLTTAGVNAMVNSLVANCDTSYPATSGASLVITQTPAQAPTGSALAQLNTLAGAPTLWNITHD